MNRAISTLDITGTSASLRVMSIFWRPTKIALQSFLTALVIGGSACGSKSTPPSSSAPPPAGGSIVEQEFNALLDKVQAKVQEGKTKEADYAAELKAFDELLARHQSEKTDEVARILATKTMLYFQIFENFPKSRELTERIKREFPGTMPAKAADDFLKQIDLQASVAVGAQFQDFHVQDLLGQPLSISALKDKIVLVDFWATWCVPCVAELPNVKAAYEKFHAKGLEIVGVSLDEDKNELLGFLKTNNVPWPQFFDGKRWTNELAVKYAISAIPATFLLDRSGKIVAKNDTLREKGLELELAKLLK